MAGARKDYDETLRLQPSHVDAHVNRGSIALRQGDLAAAAKDYQEALHWDPKCRQALEGIAELKRRGAAEVAAPSPERDEVFDISLLNEFPQPIFQAAPDYPAELRKKGITGKVLVEYIITSQGDVVQAFAVRSPHPRLAEAAVAAISRSKFLPGRKNGRAVNTRVQQEITFELQE